jgi:hypothetical protein
MVCVENNRNTVKSSDLTNVKGSSNGPGNGCLVVTVVCFLTGDELSSSLGKGDHDGSTVLGSGLHAGIDRVGSNNVNSWNGETLFLGMIEEVDECLSSDDTRLDRGRKLGEDNLWNRYDRFGMVVSFQLVRSVLDSCNIEWSKQTVSTGTSQFQYEE